MKRNENEMRFAGGLGFKTNDAETANRTTEKVYMTRFDHAPKLTQSVGKRSRSVLWEATTVGRAVPCRAGGRNPNEAVSYF